MSITQKLKKGAAWTLGRALPIQKNKVVFSSFYGRGASDNPKAIVDALAQRPEKLDIVWLAKDPAHAGVPDNVIAKAKTYLSELETGKSELAVEKKVETDQISLADVGSDEVAKRLRALDINSVTPLEALNILSELQQKARG